MERSFITEALKAADWRIRGRNGAAVALGLDEATLRSRMKKLGIHRTG